MLSSKNSKKERKSLVLDCNIDLKFGYKFTISFSQFSISSMKSDILFVHSFAAPNSTSKMPSPSSSSKVLNSECQIHIG